MLNSYDDDVILVLFNYQFRNNSLTCSTDLVNSCEHVFMTMGFFLVPTTVNSRCYVINTGYKMFIVCELWLVYTYVWIIVSKNRMYPAKSILKFLLYVHSFFYKRKYIMVFVCLNIVIQTCGTLIGCSIARKKHLLVSFIFSPRWSGLPLLTRVWSSKACLWLVVDNFHESCSTHFINVLIKLTGFHSL